MNDYNLKHITLSEESKVLKYSAGNIKKGLELARKISNVKMKITSVGESDKDIRYSSEKIWKCVGTIFHKCLHGLPHISVSPDGQIFAIFSEDRLGIEIWNIKSQKLIKTICCLLNGSSTFEITSNSKNIIIFEQHIINTRSLESGELLSSLECMPDCDDSQGSKYLRKLDESVEKAILTNSELFDCCPFSVAISPGLNLMASFHEDTIIIWSLKTGKLLHVLKSMIKEGFRNLCFANDAPILIVLNHNTYSNYEIWNPIDGTLLNTLDIHSSLYQCKVSYNGSLLISDSEFYDLPSGQMINDFYNKEEFHLIDLQSFHPSGSLSCSKDGEILVIAPDDTGNEDNHVIKIFQQLSIDEILAIEPENREIRGKLVHKLICRGNRQSKSHDYQEAIESYTTALKIDPNNSEAYNRRSTARSAIGDYQGAMEDLQQVRMI